ncbi:MAG: SURF1 family protein [Nocardioidaceae bacterium]
MSTDPAPVPPKWWSTRLWGLHALGTVVVVVTILLGWWQWSVSQGHKDEKSAALAHATPVPLSDVFGHNDAFPGEETGRPAVLQGTWLPEGTVYVSGHQDGYWVATPLRIDAASAIYVVRGWTADPDTAPAPPTGTAKLVGWLQPPEDGGLTDDDPADAMLPELNIADAMSHVGQDLYSGYAVVADREGGWPASDAAVNDGSTGLEAATLNSLPQASFTTGLRNALYALEWWVFAVFALYIWWRWVRDATHPAPAPLVPDEQEPVAHDVPSAT